MMHVKIVCLVFFWFKTLKIYVRRTMHVHKNDHLTPLGASKWEGEKHGGKIKKIIN